MDNHFCGPEHHPEFFNKVWNVFNQFPDLEELYSVSCIDHEIDLMGIDFSNESCVNDISGNKMISTFIDASTVPPGATACVWSRNRPISFLSQANRPSTRYGPEIHPDFFDAVEAVSDQHDEESKKYAISCDAYLAELMNIDFSTQGGARQIVGRTIETIYMERPKELEKPCVEWWLKPGKPRKCCKRKKA